MVPTSPARLVEVKIDGFEAPFVEQEDKRWKIVRMFSCCSSHESKMDPVYYDDGFVTEHGPFNPTQSCGQLTTPPPSPLFMDSDGKIDLKCSGDEGTEYGGVHNDRSVDMEERLVLVQTQAKSDQLQKEDPEN